MSPFGKAFRNLDLVKIFRSIVVDRRPEQASQITHLIGSRELRRMRSDLRQLLLRLRRKIRFEALRHHDLPRHRLKIERRET